MTIGDDVRRLRSFLGLNQYEFARYIGVVQPTLAYFEEQSTNGQKPTLDGLQAAPHGIDLGPLEASLPGRLATADKTIDVAPEVYAEAMSRLSDTLGSDAAHAANGTMQLIGRRDGFTCTSNL